MELPIEWLPAQGRIEQLILLLHGWGEDAQAMAPLAQALRAQFAQAAILAPNAPHAHEPSRPVAASPDIAQQPSAAALTERPDGRRQWYGVADLDAKNWPLRVNALLPPLADWVTAQQSRLGVGQAATALGGFSQGAILSLALALHHDGLVGRVLAFGGCLVEPPAAAPMHTTIHLFHGGQDPVIAPGSARQALSTLAELKGDATLDVAEQVGHTLHPALIDCALHRLSHHIPQRTWRAALGAAASPPAAAGDA